MLNMRLTVHRIAQSVNHPPRNTVSLLNVWQSERLLRGLL